MRKRTINVKAMSTGELDELYAECEAITPDTPSHPLDKSDLAAHSRAGRKRIGKGAQRINVTVERGLLAEVDAFALKTGLTRAALVAQGLRKIVHA